MPRTPHPADGAPRSRAEHFTPTPGELERRIGEGRVVPDQAGRQLIVRAFDRLFDLGERDLALEMADHFRIKLEELPR